MKRKYSRIQHERLRDILDFILNNQRATRKQLGETLGLSPASIANYIKIVIEVGLIHETEKETSSQGRRSSYLEYNPSIGVNLSIIIDHTEIRGVVINPKGVILDEYRCPLDSKSASDKIQEELTNLIDILLDKAARLHRKVFGIGIGINDYVDSSEGIVYSYFSSVLWEKIPLKKIIEDKYNIPVFLASMQHIGALGASYYGQGLDSKNFLFVWLGKGISLGIVINGELCVGEDGCAGEFGHVVVEKNGKQCTCGGVGCLETVLSESNILNLCKEGMEKGVKSEIMSICEGNLDNLTIEGVIEATNNGDRFSRNMFGKVADLLGAQLGNLVNIFNPGLIVLRGPVIDGNQFLYENICRVTMNSCLRQSGQSLKISYSTEEDAVRLKGLGSIVLNNLHQVMDTFLDRLEHSG